MRVKRDIKNVLQDLSYLQELGLVEISETKNKKVPRVAYDRIDFEVAIQIISRSGSVLCSVKQNCQSVSNEDAILPDIAVQSSRTERTADEAEREIVSAMRAWFMKDKEGDEYKGLVMNITAYGLKIQFRDIFVEGFLHVSSMADDYYRFDEKNYRLVGRRGRKSFVVGQEVTVRIERVNIEEREIQLGLV